MLCATVALSPQISDAAVKKGSAKRSVQRRAAPKRAAVKKTAPAPKAAPAVSQYRKDPYVGALAMDAKTGRVLFADGAGAIARPASVTKLMTALLVLEDVKVFTRKKMRPA